MEERRKHLHKLTELQENFEVSKQRYVKSSVLLGNLCSEINETVDDEKMESLEESYNEVKSNYWSTVTQKTSFRQFRYNCNNFGSKLGLSGRGLRS